MAEFCGRNMWLNLRLVKLIYHPVLRCVWRHIVYTLHLIYSTHNGDDAPQNNNRKHFPTAKRLGIQADHSHPSSAEDNERVEAYFHALRIPSGCVAEFKNRDILVLTPLLAFHDKAGDPVSKQQFSRFNRTVYSSNCCWTQARNDHGPTADASW